MDLVKSKAFERTSNPVDKEKTTEEVEALKKHHEAAAKPVKWVSDNQVTTDTSHVYHRVLQEAYTRQSVYYSSNLHFTKQLENYARQSGVEWALTMCKRDTDVAHSTPVAATSAMRQATLALLGADNQALKEQL